MSDKSFHLHSLSSGEKLIQLASDSLVTEILIQPQLSTLKQCMRNLLASFTRHRHVIHAGYTLSGPGSWILQVWWPFTHSLFWWCRPRKCSCLSFRFFFFFRTVRTNSATFCTLCEMPKSSGFIELTNRASRWISTAQTRVNGAPTRSIKIQPSKRPR